jgi:tRNA1(Val) A37 N6-methylase TrmN6
MKPFRFQQFSIQQQKCFPSRNRRGFAWCDVNVKNAQKILEVGTGTGLFL